MTMENANLNGWKEARLKNVAKYINGRAFKPEEWMNEGLPIVRIQNLTDLDAEFNYSPNTYEPEYLIKDGDLLFSWSASLDAFIWNRGDAWLNQHIFKVEPNIGVDKYYLYYELKSIIRDIYLQAHGSGMVHVTKGTFENVKVMIPPIEEQKAIAKYLNYHCSQIDALIAVEEETIAELQAYKQSVIAEAVTKGLNPDAPMKDSGIPWIGQIPAHWEVKRLGSLYNQRNEKVSDKDFRPLSVTMKGILPQLETAAKTNDGDNRKLVRKGDFAINSRSDRRGSCGISAYDGSVSLINTVLVPLENMCSSYYNWLFHTPNFADEFYKWGHGIVDDLWTTRWSEMKNINVPCAGVKEQEAISEYLDRKCSEIDSLIEIKQQKISELKEYKKSLIYEYVTGKKEVPAVAD